MTDYRQRCEDAAMTAWSEQATMLCEHSQIIPIGVVVDAVLAVRDEVLEELRTALERRIDADAEALADQTLMKGLTVKDGAVNLDLIPPREIAAIWVHCAVGMLGDAPNYTETEVKMPSVSMEISPAGTYDRYALIVQRVGRLTPHEARQQAEAERDELRELVRELAYDGPCQYDHDDQCQAHALHERPCPHGRAQELLADFAPKEDQ
ncbi:hypothetical protein ACU635_50795 [[Actinomadura] parvosata]|uniref:hypothetical protein n=1 Tax=[Actinomadura] parvosata TaxID=1955412 RepID=UPI00406C7D0E